MSTDNSGFAAITEVLGARARSHPDRAPLCVDGKSWLTFGEWDLRSNGVAHGLLDSGVRRGDRVGLLFSGMEWFDYAIAYFGVLKAGATATHLCDALGPEEIRRRLGHAEAVGLLHAEETTTPDHFQGWSATVSGVEAGGVESPDQSAPNVEIGPDDICDILYTSGTTGPAKPFLNPHGNVSFGRGWGAQAEAIFDQTKPLLSPLPLGTAYSASTVGVFALTTTSPIIVSPPDDVVRMAELVEQHQIASVMVRPRAAMEMVRTRVADRHDLSCVTILGVASGALPPRYARELQAMMRNAKISTAYGGGSEAVPAHLRTIYSPDRPQNMGAAQTGTDMQIVDEDGRPLPTGSLGEIWLRTAAPRRRYLDTSLNGDVFVEEGWVRTGDLGRVDDDGELYFFDRGKDAIRTAMGLVSSIEVENALYEHPAVGEAAVFAVPGPSGSWQVAAAVTLTSSEPQYPDLQAFLADRLARHEVPVVIHVLDSMPRGAVSDKILKAVLRERFAVT